MEIIDVKRILLRSLSRGIARAPLDAVVRNRKPNPNVRRQGLCCNASDCILDLRTLERADANIDGDGSRRAGRSKRPGIVLAACGSAMR